MLIKDPPSRGECAVVDKNVTRLRQACGQLVAFTRRYAGQIAAEAGGPGGDLPAVDRRPVDLNEYTVAVGDFLDALRAELERWRDRLAAEIGRGRDLRRLREELVEGLRQTLRQVTGTLSGCYLGSAIRVVLEQVVPLPADPVALRQAADWFAAQLVDPGFDPGPPRPGVEVDLPAVARRFEEPARRLGEVIAELSANETEVVFARAERDAAAERLRDYSERAGRYYEALCELIGNRKLAARVRRILRG